MFLVSLIHMEQDSELLTTDRHSECSMRGVNMTSPTKWQQSNNVCTALGWFSANFHWLGLIRFFAQIPPCDECFAVQQLPSRNQFAIQTNIRFRIHSRFYSKCQDLTPDSIRNLQYSIRKVVVWLVVLLTTELYAQLFTLLESPKQSTIEYIWCRNYSNLTRMCQRNFARSDIGLPCPPRVTILRPVVAACGTRRCHRSLNCHRGFGRSLPVKHWLCLDADLCRG